MTQHELQIALFRILDKDIDRRRKEAEGEETIPYTQWLQKTVQEVVEEFHPDFREKTPTKKVLDTLFNDFNPKNNKI